MSIYIKGMEMPEDGVYWCEIGVAGDIATITIHGEERKSFPLIPIPEPHGRLGDLDALMLKIREYIDEYGELDENGFHSEKWCAMKEAEMVICEAPTVIPASKDGLSDDCF